MQADRIAAEHGRLAVAGHDIRLVGDTRSAGAMPGSIPTTAPSCGPAVRRSSAGRPHAPRSWAQPGERRSRPSADPWRMAGETGDDTGQAVSVNEPR